MYIYIHMICIYICISYVKMGRGLPSQATTVRLPVRFLLWGPLVRGGRGTASADKC